MHTALDTKLGFRMPLEIKTEIQIKKAPEVVWKVFNDFSSYPKWNPFLTKIQQISDRKLEVEFMGKSTFKPIILKNEPNQEFRWFGKLGGVNWLFTGEHYFIVKPEKEGATFIHGENFNGILAWLLWPFLKKNLERNYMAMNQALKERVESHKSHRSRV
jgi:hypothetical protein